MKAVRGVTSDALRPVVDWLASDQAPDAVVSHHGVGTRIGEFYVRIAPGPPSGRNSGSVVIFEVIDWQRDGDGPHAEIVNGIPPEQRDALGKLLAQVVPVLDSWNGDSSGCVTCSFHIDRGPGEGVRRARANYVPFKTPDSVTGIGS